jgi:hypothetical protein
MDEAADADIQPLGCAGCHRVADGQFCSSFSRQAVGFSQRAETQTYDPESAFRFGSHLVYWMSPGGRTYDRWHGWNEDDIKILERCCQNSDPRCVWRDGF